MKKNPYAIKMTIIQGRPRRGNRLISSAAITSITLAQRSRPPSLKWPKIGLLIAEARKIPDSAMPANLGSKAWAFCRKREADVAIAPPAKSLRLKAKLAARKKAQRAGVGKIWTVFLDTGAIASSAFDCRSPSS